MKPEFNWIITFKCYFHCKVESNGIENFLCEAPSKYCHV